MIYSFHFSCNFNLEHNVTQKYNNFNGRANFLLQITRLTVYIAIVLGISSLVSTGIYLV